MKKILGVVIIIMTIALSITLSYVPVANTEPMTAIDVLGITELIIMWLSALILAMGAIIED